MHFFLAGHMGWYSIHLIENLKLKITTLKFITIAGIVKTMKLCKYVLLEWNSGIPGCIHSFNTHEKSPFRSYWRKASKIKKERQTKEKSECWSATWEGVRSSRHTKRQCFTTYNVWHWIVVESYTITTRVPITTHSIAPSISPNETHYVEYSHVLLSATWPFPSHWFLLLN